MAMTVSKNGWPKRNQSIERTPMIASEVQSHCRKMELFWLWDLLISNDDNGIDTGKVQTFEFASTNNNWSKMGQDLLGANNCDTFEISLSLSSDGRKAAIGARILKNVQSTKGNLCPVLFYVVPEPLSGIC